METEKQDKIAIVYPKRPIRDSNRDKAYRKSRVICNLRQLNLGEESRQVQQYAVHYEPIIAEDNYPLKRKIIRQLSADLKGYLTYKAGGQDHPNGTGSETPENWTPEGANQNGKQVFFYLRPGTGCYECVISQNKLDFSIDDILSFKSEVTLQTGGTPLPISNRVRQAYMRALARERGAKSRFSSNTSGIKGFGN